MARTIAELEGRRTAVLKEIAEIGDMRRGSIAERYRQCGKHPCCCEQADHPGHGPYYSLTVKAEGTTVTRHVAAGGELAKVQREIGAFRRFQDLVPQLVAVNEEICEARPVEPVEGGVEEVSERQAMKKKLPKSSKRRSRGRSSR
jgi:hypothetical protein